MARGGCRSRTEGTYSDGEKGYAEEAPWIIYRGFNSPVETTTKKKSNVSYTGVMYTPLPIYVYVF